MNLAIVLSKNGVSIRLTDERWNHIITTHLEMDPKDFKVFMDVVSNPDQILKGKKGELLAIKKASGKKTWIVVPYKEVSQQEGFVLTAYYTTDLTWLLKKEIMWNKE